MFYGGVNDVFVGLTTLALTLVLQTFMAQTAGPEWTVGEARLNGYNGMYMPQISIGDAPLYGRPLYFLYLGMLIGVYLLLRWLAGTRWGYGLLALQENRPRTETFGYNVRLMQVQVFALAGARGRSQRRALRLLGELHRPLLDGADGRHHPGDLRRHRGPAQSDSGDDLLDDPAEAVAVAGLHRAAVRAGHLRAARAACGALRAGGVRGRALQRARPLGVPAACRRTTPG